MSKRRTKKTPRSKATTAKTGQPMWPELRPDYRPPPGPSMADALRMQNVGVHPGAPAPGQARVFCGACIDAPGPCETCAKTCVHQIVNGRCVLCDPDLKAATKSQMHNDRR